MFERKGYKEGYTAGYVACLKEYEAIFTGRGENVAKKIERLRSLPFHEPLVSRALEIYELSKAK